MIKRLLRKFSKASIVWSLQRDRESIGDNIQNNFSLDSNSLLQLLGYKVPFQRFIGTPGLKGEDATLPDGGSYRIVTSKHLLKIPNIIHKALGLKKLKH